MRVRWRATPLDEEGRVIGPPTSRWSDLPARGPLTAPPGLFDGRSDHWELAIKTATNNAVALMAEQAVTAVEQAEGKASMSFIDGYTEVPLMDRTPMEDIPSVRPPLTDSEKARLEGPGVPWDALDRGIVPIVEALTLAGFKTVASCQGHGEGDAWVVILDDLQTGIIDQLEALVDRCGWARHCVISQEQEIGGAESWVRLRWWGGVPYR